MLGQKDSLNKNLKDTVKDTKNMPAPYEAEGFRSGSVFFQYNKVNKLITALYMVTDTMEKDEPLRLKLRTLGIEILSDTSAMSKRHFDIQKIDQVLSFLNIASDVGMISEMNCNILKKEFSELKQSIKEFTEQNHFWLEEFIKTSSDGKPDFSSFKTSPLSKGREYSKGQRTRIGVQKGSNLMKALNDVQEMESGTEGFHSRFEMLKSKRREKIIGVIKDKPEGMSIKDIALAMQNLGEEIGGKTLQRELISMVSDNVLKKTGEKRWSMYALGSSN